MGSGYRVKQAREFKGMTQEQLAERIGVVQSAVAQIEADLITPTDVVLNSISLQTGFPKAFFRDAPDFEFPLPSHLLLRARQAFSARDKKQAHRWAEVAFEAVARILPRLSIPPVSLPMEAEDPVSAAESLRAVLGISPDGAIRSAVKAAEKAGILVFSIPLPRQCDAFSCWVRSSTRRPVIFISRSLVGDRQNWSVAHELGHLILHDAMHSSKSAEKEANEFAADLLLPADAFRESIGAPLTLTAAGTLKRRWFVAIQAILMRARDLGLVDDGQYKSMMVQISRRGWRTREPYPIAPDQPSMVRRIVERLYGDPIDIRRFASDARISSALAERLLGGSQDDRDQGVTSETG